MTDPLGVLKQNWRIAVLVVLLMGSAYFLFVPGAPITGTAADADTAGESELAVDVPDAEANTQQQAGMTNLQYGIELGGGARVIAPVKGLTAEEIPVTVEDPDLSPEERVSQTEENVAEVESSVAAAMTNVSENNVRVYHGYESARQGSYDDDAANSVEVLIEGDPEEFATGLQNAGYDVTTADIRPGVTNPTREQIVEVLSTRLGEAGFSGGSVTQVRGGDQTRIAVEAPGQDTAYLRSLIEERGLVETVLHQPADNEQGYTREVIFRQDAVDDIGTVSTAGGQPGIPITLTESGAEQYVDTLRSSGFAETAASGRACQMAPGQEVPDANSGSCLMTVVDGEVVWAGGMEPDLAQSILNGDFLENPNYRITTTTQDESQELRLNLISGALPAELSLEESTEYFFSPALAEGFQTNSLLTGIIAIFAVVLMIFLRYGDPLVAVPMSVTGLSEVVILLGFASAVGLPLNLSHVAGFIVVVGTGVDDLIIIADEVMDEGEVSSHHVFDSRFRKAFWVIGAAAATTIVAMSPLAILDLGDLRGFAIITVLGVLIGVSVTRPAYGNILRSLKTEGR